MTGHCLQTLPLVSASTAPEAQGLKEGGESLILGCREKNYICLSVLPSGPIDKAVASKERNLGFEVHLG